MANLTPVETALETAVQAAKNVFFDVRRKALAAYWEIGKSANSLNTTYGESTIKQFAQRLRQELADELSESTVYRARQFYQRTPKEKLEALLSSNVSWGQVVPTLSVDNSVVEEIIDKLNNEEIPPSRFASEVKKAAEEAKQAEGFDSSDDSPDPVAGDEFDQKPETDKTFKYTITKCHKSLEAGVTALADVLIIVDQFANLPAASKKLYQKQMDDLVEQLKVCTDAASNVHKECLNRLNDADDNTETPT